jgi:hypothetical protein
VTEALIEEGRRMAKPMLADISYLPSVAARAWRWTPEMLEVAATLDHLGLPDNLALAAAAVMQRWEADQDKFEMGVPEVLKHLRS